jgi:hypothetical protein
MKSVFTLLIMTAAVLPTSLAAQELDVTRKRYTFLDNRLDIAVLADAPGVLQVVRGQRGLVEVAARSRDGFAAFALGGNTTRELRLTAVGSEAVNYLVVVPERVYIRVLLPEGRSMTLGPTQAVGTWEWGTLPPRSAPAGAPGGAPPTPSSPVPSAGDAELGGMYTVHRDTWAPQVIDVPNLDAVRTISLRFEGGEFRVAASRPLAVQPGSRSHMELRLDGEPVDVVIYVPRGRADFALRSGGQTLARMAADQPTALCGNVVVHAPSTEQTRLTFYPQAGRLDCR